MISGKTIRILNRFPDFYISEDPTDLLHQWIDIMGVMLDRTEADLAKVLRSRFIDTAENASSQGFLGERQGDLDRIFALYLEKLGGTSQLTRTSQVFQPNNLKQVSDLVRQLVNAETTLTAYLWDCFLSATQHLLSRYAVVNARFPDTFLLPLPALLLLVQDPDVLALYKRLPLPSEAKQALQEPAIFNAVWLAVLESLPQQLGSALIEQAIALANRRDRLQESIEETLVSLVVKLITGKDLFTAYIFSQLTKETQQQLDQYDGAVPVPLSLKRSLATDFNQLLRNRLLDDKFQDYTTQIRFAQVVQTLNYATASSAFQAAHNTFAQALRKRLTLPAQKLLFALTDADPIPAAIPTSLRQELTPLFSDRYFIQPFLETITAPSSVSPAPVASEPEGLSLAKTAIATLLQAALEVMTNLLLGQSSDFSGNGPAERNTFTLPILSLETQRLLDQNPVGEDLERLNRMLLEAVYPQLILPSGIPSAEQAQATLSQALNQEILSDPRLYHQNQNWFLNLTLASETEPLIAALNQEPGLAPEDLTRLNRLLLEAAFPTQLERRDAPYRDRLLRLITVLKTGASTKEGIVDIVAANLGISITTPNEVRPWEAFLFDLPLESEASLSSLTASPGLRQAFAERGTLLSYSATLAMDQPQRRWIITDINTAQVYVVRRRTNRFSVHRQLIRVIEFLPEPEFYTHTVHPYPKPLPPGNLSFPEPLEFSIFNPNPLPTVPAIQVKLRDRRPEQERISNLIVSLPLSFQTTLNRLVIPSNLRQTLEQADISLSPEATVEIVLANQQWNIHDLDNRQTYSVIREGEALQVHRRGVLSPLTNVRLVHENGQFVQYTSTLSCDDVLLFLPDGTILVNGRVWRTFTTEGTVLINEQTVDNPPPELVSRIPPLSLKQTRWRIEASIGYARATFEQTLFDSSKFEQSSLDPINPDLAGSYVFDVNFSFYRLTPGSFLVKIPWDIPGYTDQFDATHDHPRHQINALIGRVRGAGMRSVIAYEKTFQEYHEMEIGLVLERSPFTEIQDMEEYNFDIQSQQKPYAKGIEHEMTDKLITSAVFDYSRFDSMNRFG